MTCSNHTRIKIYAASAKVAPQHNYDASRATILYTRPQYVATIVLNHHHICTELFCMHKTVIDLSYYGLCNRKPTALLIHIWKPCQNPAKTIHILAAFLCHTGVILQCEGVLRWFDWYISCQKTFKEGFTLPLLYSVEKNMSEGWKEGAQINLSIDPDEDFIRGDHPVNAVALFPKTTEWKTQLCFIDPTGHRWTRGWLQQSVWGHHQSS